jgi:hypothetical protein
MAAIGISGIALVVLYESIINSSHKEEIINLADDPKGVEKWTLGRATSIAGANTLMLSLISENKEVDTLPSQTIAADSYYSKRSYNPAKNILFIDNTSNKSFWLFSSTSQLVLDAEPFPHSYQIADKYHDKVIFYQVVTSDTNGDEILNKNDKSSLAITSPDGTGYRVIMDGFDKIITKTLTDNNNILVVYNNDGDVYSMLYDTSRNKVLSTHKIPRVNNS